MVAIFATWWWFAPTYAFARLVRSSTKLPYRITEARLTDFPFAPAPQRSARRASTLNSSVLVTLLRGRSDAVSLRDSGIASLLGTEGRQALALLEKAAVLHPRDPAVWNDLAAVRHSVAESAGDASLRADALGAIHRALLLRPDSAEARFNKGVILEGLGLHDSAARSYEMYLTLDTTSLWATEARTRIARLQPARFSFHSDLNRALTAGDHAIASVVSTHRWEARVRAHGSIDSWAEALGKYDTTAATKHLQTAAAIGKALAAVQGDTFITDTTRAIQRASDSDRHRVASALATFRSPALRGSTC